MSDKLATVTGFFDSGAAKVKFDGEEEESKKEYPFMKHCIPKEGDRVYMKEFADSYIIYGVVLFETAPEKLDGTEGDWTVNGVVKAKSAEITENLRAATLEGKLTGDVKGNVTGDLTGNVKGNVEGDVTGKVKGDVEGNVKGNLTGNVTGNVNGNTTGFHTGNVRGNVTGNLNGNVTASTVTTGSLTCNQGMTVGGRATFQSSLSVSSTIEAQGNISTRGWISGNGLTVSGIRTSNGNVGFFGASPASRTMVQTLGSSSSLAQVISSYNSLLNGLKRIGLIG